MTDVRDLVPFAVEGETSNVELGGVQRLIIHHEVLEGALLSAMPERIMLEQPQQPKQAACG